MERGGEENRLLPQPVLHAEHGGRGLPRARPRRSRDDLVHQGDPIRHRLQRRRAVLGRDPQSPPRRHAQGVCHRRLRREHAGTEIRRHAARAFARRAAPRRHRARHRPHRDAALRGGESARSRALSDEPARRGFDDGRAVGGHAQAAARAAYQAGAAGEERLMAQRDDHSRALPSFGFGKCGKIATPPIRAADRGLAMPASAIIARAIAAAIIVAAAPVAGSAQPTLKIFDAHLHYNQEPNPYYPLERVLDVFRRNGVAGILANSRPNKGTHQLVDAKASGLWVVPFIRPYRTRDDVQNWSTDPAIYDLIEAEYKRGYFRGIGEFHIYGNAAQAPLVKQVVDFAAGRNLYLLAHCDEAALLILLAHNRSAKIIWAHTRRNSAAFGFIQPQTRGLFGV